MKLKTIKDLLKEDEHKEMDSYAFSILKKEAIKHVKAWMEKLSNGVLISIGEDFHLNIEPKNIQHYDKDYRLLGSIVGFVNFFNISEEDLK